MWNRKKIDGFIKKKIKESETERKTKDEGKYTEKLRYKDDAAYLGDWKIDSPNNREQKWYLQSFKEREQTTCWSESYSLTY